MARSIQEIKQAAASLLQQLTAIEPDIRGAQRFRTRGGRMFGEEVTKEEVVETISETRKHLNQVSRRHKAENAMADFEGAALEVKKLLKERITIPLRSELGKALTGMRKDMEVVHQDKPDRKNSDTFRKKSRRAPSNKSTPAPTKKSEEKYKSEEKVEDSDLDN